MLHALLCCLCVCTLFVSGLATRMESAKVPGPKVFCRADKNEEEARGWYGLRPDVLFTERKT